MRDIGLVSIGPNLLKSCAGISGMPAPAGAAADVACTGAAAGPRRNESTSSLVTRPFSPVPFTLFRSTSSSRATRRTPGLAWTPEKSGSVDGVGAGAGTTALGADAGAAVIAAGLGVG